MGSESSPLHPPPKPQPHQSTRPPTGPAPRIHPTPPRSPDHLTDSTPANAATASPSPPRHRSGHPSHRSGLPNHQATRSRRDHACGGTSPGRAHGRGEHDAASHRCAPRPGTTPARTDPRPSCPPSHLDRVALVTPPLLEGSGFSPSRLRSTAMLDRRVKAEVDVDLGPDPGPDLDLDLDVRTVPATRTRPGDTGGLVHEHRQQPPATRVQARSTQSRSRRAVDATPWPIDRAVRLLAGGAQQKHGQSLHRHLPPSVTRPSRYRQTPTKSGGRERGLLRRQRRAVTSARI
ncbi:hypothetical protein HD596_006573 [Nonomuraea jabiensis]|uniref:Uncharacterized protein n=1 Tax=Nonomuraea jabiensis TaxID=882448 RepID=A0A7W9LDG9_9ACTN|nr:hypothetical protein [Nonomuraea jabiensis]